MSKSLKSNRKRQVDKIWEQIFQDYDILNKVKKDNVYSITSTEINKYKEARLMTKFDFEDSLPDIFASNDLAILPTTRGTYNIGPFNLYQNLGEFKGKKKEVVFPDWIETIEPENLTSESIMINAALATTMMADLLNENQSDLVQSLSGRMGSGKFSFNVNSTYTGRPLNVEVENSQIEIDAGIETPEKLVLIEAKNKPVEDFIGRQLYYPYRTWTKKTDKEIVPVFLQYTNGIFDFSVFKYNDKDNYNSLELIKRNHYVFGGENVTVDDLIEVSSSVQSMQGHGDENVPFPQADDMVKILGIVEAIHHSEDGQMSKEEISLSNAFVMRQADYYSNSAIWLGLIKKVDRKLALTEIGKEYIHSNRKNQVLLIAKRVLRYEPANRIFKHGISRANPLSGTEAARLLGKFHPGLEASTNRRRAVTLSAWVKYLIKAAE